MGLALLGMNFCHGRYKIEISLLKHQHKEENDDKNMGEIKI